MQSLKQWLWGKIILGSKNSGHKEIIEHGKNGFLFDHDYRR